MQTGCRSEGHICIMTNKLTNKSQNAKRLQPGALILSNKAIGWLRVQHTGKCVYPRNGDEKEN